jgi:hypothetical protein
MPPECQGRDDTALGGKNALPQRSVAEAPFELLVDRARIAVGRVRIPVDVAVVALPRAVERNQRIARPARRLAEAPEGEPH